MQAETPSDQLCRQASSEGVMLLAELNQTDAATTQSLTQQLVRLHRHAAVAMVVLPSSVSLSSAARNRIPNLMLVQKVSDVAGSETAPWADLAFIRCDNSASAEKFAAISRLPLLCQFNSDKSSAAEASVTENVQHAEQLLADLPAVAGVLYD